MSELIFTDKNGKNINTELLYFDTLNKVENIFIQYINEHNINGGWNAIANNYRQPLWKIGKYLVVK